MALKAGLGGRFTGVSTPGGPGTRRRGGGPFTALLARWRRRFRFYLSPLSLVCLIFLGSVRDPFCCRRSSTPRASVNSGFLSGPSPRLDLEFLVLHAHLTRTTRLPLPDGWAATLFITVFSRDGSSQL